jgi:hypothetical protein
MRHTFSPMSKPKREQKPPRKDPPKKAKPTKDDAPRRFLPAPAVTIPEDL